MQESNSIYGYMYGKPYILRSTERKIEKIPDKIIEIKKKELQEGLEGYIFIWGYPGPDYNYYKFSDYGITWAFTEEELNGNNTYM